MPYMYPYPYPYPPSYGPPQYPYPPGPGPAAQSHPYPPSPTYPPFYAQSGPGSYGPSPGSVYASAEFGYGDTGRASVDHCMRMSSASQGWGLPTSRSAVFNSANFANSTVASLDREAAYNSQQPLMMDLIQELRRSKKEAQWARQKLAETIVLIGAPASPVLSASAQNADTAKPQVAPVPTQASAPRKVGDDEVEEDEEEDENEYSDDFEANNENEEAKRVQQEKREPAQKPPSEAFTAAKLSTAPPGGPAWSEQSRYAVMNPLKESLAHSLLASQVRPPAIHYSPSTATPLSTLRCTVCFALSPPIHSVCFASSQCARPYSLSVSLCPFIHVFNARIILVTFNSSIPCRLTLSPFSLSRPPPRSSSRSSWNLCARASRPPTTSPTRWLSE
jgi:hypothetical protein